MKTEVDVNISEIVSAIKPWNFFITIGGSKYKIRRLSGIEFKKLNEFHRQPFDAVQKIISDIIDGDKPGAEIMDDPEYVLTIATAVVGYYQQTVIGKNAELAIKASAIKE